MFLVCKFWAVTTDISEMKFNMELTKICYLLKQRLLYALAWRRCLAAKYVANKIFESHVKTCVDWKSFDFCFET